MPRLKGRHDDGRSPAPPVTALRTLARVGVFVRPYRRQVIFAAIALVVAAGAVLAIGQGLKGVIDRGFGTGERASSIARWRSCWAWSP